MSILHRRAHVNARRRALGGKKRQPLPHEFAPAHEREPRPADYAPASSAALAQLAAQFASASRGATKKKRARK